MSQHLRRHNRLVIPGPIRISWQESSGFQKYVRGVCLDVSASGIRVEVVEPIPLRTFVTVGADSIKLVANASVRHSVRKGSKYLIGMEFNCPIKALAERLIAEYNLSEEPRAESFTASENS